MTIKSSEFKKPICPFCNSKMIVVKYKGYYDSFHYWECPRCNDTGLKDLEEDWWSGSMHKEENMNG